ncbi:MAG: flagellar biosynthesis protein [Clostridia bacterium]|nr:flagellar biosynthesis protein [Clostridia bacterium]
MDEIFEMLLPLIGVIGIILLAYVSTRWLSKKYNNMNSGKYIKIIERTVLNKDSYLVLIEIASKKHLLSVSPQKAEVLLSFEEDELPQTFSSDNKFSKLDFNSILSSVINTNKFFDKKDNTEQKNEVREKKI